MERDAQLLANRIALLKQEEMRTWKKIEETKKRATEVIKLKQKNQEKMQAKWQVKTMEEQRIAENRQKVYEEKARRKQEM